MKKIALVRHGETEGNTRRIVQGTLEWFKLTERGHRQVIAAREFLGGIFSNAVIWSSSLGRALESARLLTVGTGFSGPIALNNLKQRDWGSSTGKSYDEFLGEVAYISEPGEIVSPDAETITEVRERLLSVRAMIQKHSALNHIIVSHNEVLNYILDFWQTGKLRKVTFLSGEVMLFELDEVGLLVQQKTTMFPPRLVHVDNAPSFIEAEEAVNRLVSHGLQIVNPSSREAMENVVAIIVGDSYFGVEDAKDFPRLRTVARFGAGLNNVDVKGLWDTKRVFVSSTPGLSTGDISEFALAMLILTLRGAVADARSLSSDNPKWRSIGRGIALKDATIGIVGCGRIGLDTAKLLLKHGAKVLLWNNSWPPKNTTAEFLGQIERITNIRDLAGRCDAISIHLALTTNTKHIVGNDFFEEVRKCGKSIALVNTSRGEIVDEESLLAALQNGVVKSAAIDVWSREGNNTNQTINALRVHPSVFPTSHIAAYTLESRRRCALQCADNVIAAVEGRLKGIEQYIAKPAA